MDIEKVNDCIDTLLFNKGELKQQEATDIIDVLHECVKSKEHEKVDTERMTIKEVDDGVSKIIFSKSNSITFGEECKILDMIDECVETRKSFMPHYHFQKRIEERDNLNITEEVFRDIMSVIKGGYVDLHDVNLYSNDIRQLEDKLMFKGMSMSNKEKLKTQSELYRLQILDSINRSRTRDMERGSKNAMEHKKLERELKETNKKLEYALKRNCFLSKWT
jgi:polyhydroxyalkanoate synthesis regulator phasin